MAECKKARLDNTATETNPKYQGHARLAYHILFAKDMPAAIKFYTEVFGWELYPCDPKMLEQWAELKSGSHTVLALHKLEDSKSDGAIPQADNLLGSSAVGLFVDSCDEFHGRISKMDGVTVLLPPTKQFWGGVQAKYLTPENHVLSVVEGQGYPDEMRCKAMPSADDGAKEVEEKKE